MGRSRRRNGAGKMIKLGAAVLVASFVAGLAVTAPGVTPLVKAHTYAIKGERLVEVRNYGSACSERGWPYFETSCLRDTNSPAHEARTVRMVGTDRPPAPR